MRRTTRGFFTLTIMAVTVGLFLLPGHSAEAQQPALCESGAHYGDFDFWLGEWNVYAYNSPDQYQGHNSIIKSEGNCLMREQWTGAAGGTGFSMNFYNPGGDEWRQLWVSSGSIIDYAGGLNEQGQMVLEGSITYHANSKSFPFRGTWTALDEGAVRQFFEQYDPVNEVWQVWFDGLYIRDDDALTNGH